MTNKNNILMVFLCVLSGCSPAAREFIVSVPAEIATDRAVDKRCAKIVSKSERDECLKENHDIVEHYDKKNLNDIPNKEPDLRIHQENLVK